MGGAAAAGCDGAWGGGGVEVLVVMVVDDDCDVGRLWGGGEGGAEVVVVDEGEGGGREGGEGGEVGGGEELGGGGGDAGELEGVDVFGAESEVFGPGLDEWDGGLLVDVGLEPGECDGARYRVEVCGGCKWRALGSVAVEYRPPASLPIATVHSVPFRSTSCRYLALDSERN